MTYIQGDPNTEKAINNDRHYCGAGGLTPLGVRIPPPVHCPDRFTSQSTGRGRGNPKGKPHAWELIWGARNMLALVELAVMFASGTPPPIA